MQKDYYVILGISKDASEGDIKKAYRINAIKYHPDKNFGDKEFSNKFIEIKEAYDNLIDPNKRKAFDINYKEFYSQNESFDSKYFNSESKTKSTQRKEEFKYEPLTSFFSVDERERQATPQFPPEYTPWGKPIPDNTIFFIYPKNIGKIIGGASNTIKDKDRETLSGYQTKTIKKIFRNILIISILFILNFSYLKYMHRESAIQTAILLWTIVAIIRTLLTLFWYNIHKKSIYSYSFNYFIGINGFAYYNYEEPKQSMHEEIEINFNEVTDLFRIYESNEFLWVNRFSKKSIYYANMNNSTVDELAKIEMNQFAEKYFTIYLLDNMEMELESKGYIEFILVPNIPYIRLGIGFITFLKGKDNITYNFNDIKRLYTQEMQLFIEHKNYQKVLFFKTGNQNSIPLKFLGNRQFFYKAMEILLGYKIN